MAKKLLKPTVQYLPSSKQQTDTIRAVAGEHSGAVNIERDRYFSQELVETELRVIITYFYMMARVPT